MPLCLSLSLHTSIGEYVEYRKVEYIKCALDAMWMGALLCLVTVAPFCVYLYTNHLYASYVKMIHIIVYSIDGTRLRLLPVCRRRIRNRYRPSSIDDDAVEMDTQHDIHLFNILSCVPYTYFRCIYIPDCASGNIHPHGIKCYLFSLHTNTVSTYI